MTTCEPSPAPNWRQTELQLMSSPADFPAKTSAPPGNKPELMKPRAADYGQKSPVWLAKYDRATSSWRTSQHCLVAQASGEADGLAEFSETWPRSGMMRSGTAFQLPTLVPLTGEIASGSWATPRTTDGTGGARKLDEKGRRVSQSNPNLIFGANLADQVRRWSTPRSCSAMAANFTENTLTAPFPNLEREVAQSMFPTPTAGDYKDGPSSKTNSQRGRAGGDTLGVTVAGHLNPTWVEWLMGFPSEWTALKPSETPSSRKSRK